MSDSSPQASATVAQLRHDIDSGRTGDKTPGFDPAAAPLGVDDEAGGTPLAPELIAQARVQERAGRPTSRQPNAAEPSVAPDGRAPRRGLFVGLALGVAAGGLIGAMFLVAASF